MINFAETVLNVNNEITSSTDTIGNITYAEAVHVYCESASLVYQLHTYIELYRESGADAGLLNRMTTWFTKVFKNAMELVFKPFEKLSDYVIYNSNTPLFVRSAVRFVSDVFNFSDTKDIEVGGDVLTAYRQIRYWLSKGDGKDTFYSDVMPLLENADKVTTETFDALSKNDIKKVSDFAKGIDICLKQIEATNYIYGLTPKIIDYVKLGVVEKYSREWFINRGKKKTNEYMYKKNGSVVLSYETPFKTVDQSKIHNKMQDIYNDIMYVLSASDNGADASDIDRKLKHAAMALDSILDTDTSVIDLKTIVESGIKDPKRFNPNDVVGLVKLGKMYDNRDVLTLYFRSPLKENNVPWMLKKLGYDTFDDKLYHDMRSLKLDVDRRITAKQLEIALAILSLVVTAWYIHKVSIVMEMCQRAVLINNQVIYHLYTVFKYEAEELKG